MKSKKGKKLTEKEFNLIKLLIKNGMPKIQIVEVMGRSYMTVYFAEKANSLDNYTSLVRERAAKYGRGTKTTEPVSEVKGPVSTGEMDKKNTLTVQLRTIEFNQLQEIDLLKEIRNLLSEIAEKQPETSKPKKFW